MHIQTDRAYIPAGSPAVRYLHIVINAPARKDEGASRAPASVALVLDRSGSMDGQKITMAREAVAYAARLLKSTDHLAIVCYDEEISTVLDRTAASNEAKKLALDRLATIGARGATDLHGGWMRGAELLASGLAASNGISKVMLMTDGRANRGVTDHADLVAAAQRLRAQGVVTSTFGVGRDFDENLLSAIAVNGGGHFYFIERPKQIPDFLASELGETLEVVARDVELEIAFDPGVEAAVLNEIPNQRHANRIRIHIGNLVSEQEVSLVVAVAFKGAHTEGSGLGVQCWLTDRDGVLPSFPLEVTWDAVDALKDANQPVNADVVFAAATVVAERARRRALALNAEGKFEAAKQIIDEVLNDLRVLAQDNDRVLRIIDKLHRDALEIGEMMDPMARKAKHFAAYQMMYSRTAEGKSKRKEPR